jgi:hypothetical protein
MKMDVNGIAHGPPQPISSSLAVQRQGFEPVASPPVQESAQVELSPIGSAVSGPTGFAKTGIAAYNSIAA